MSSSYTQALITQMGQTPVCNRHHSVEQQLCRWLSYDVLIRGQTTRHSRTATRLLEFLIASRYCEVDRMTAIAWQLFGAVPAGWPRVRAVCNYVHGHLTFDYLQARNTRTAYEAYQERVGVCRDFTHLAVTLCRCLNIPARYCTGYLGDIGIPAAPDPRDFSAWFEAYLGGEWYTLDARHNSPRIGRVLMARGRDAADVALLTSFGQSRLEQFTVRCSTVCPSNELRMTANVTDFPPKKISGWFASARPPAARLGVRHRTDKPPAGAHAYWMAAIPNMLLSTLSRKAYREVLPDFSIVTLTFGQILYETNMPMRDVFFPNSGLVSLLTPVVGHSDLEVGMVGREGMVGTPLALGIDLSPGCALVQAEGTALRMSRARFLSALRRSLPLRRSIHRYVQALIGQITQTAVCNRFHLVDQRLARWLLMTRDRLGTGQFRMTQRFLAHMLGVRREGVTEAASAFQRRNLIQYSRGKIEILDHDGLEAACCSCYRRPSPRSGRSTP